MVEFCTKSGTLNRISHAFCAVLCCFYCVTVLPCVLSVITVLHVVRNNK